MQRRRRVLKMLAAASLTASACAEDETAHDEQMDLTSGGPSGGDATPVDFPAGYVHVGNAGDLPAGVLVGFAALELIVGRDDAGIYAMTSRCSHQDCQMIGNGGIHPSGISCDCHHTEFDVNGEVLSGPADSPLAHYAVLVDDLGNVGVNRDVLVGIDERAPVDPP